MARQLRSVELDFADTAPVRLVFTGTMAAPPDAVYRALATETESWPEWFSGLTEAAATPEGRTVRLTGGSRFRETVLAAQPDVLYAYRTDETNAPGVRALLEAWRLAPAGDGTRVRWTVATDGTVLYRAVLRGSRPAMGRTFRSSVRALDRRLTKT
ncbi:SRPBCC family protein [Streptomyces sp. GMY02]|uniref:SRPBCC family protein n=1 Tax=Streptomyces sp. GMY02 TaxID=1333528 RepID=UPI001C2BD6D6|nr:SRPBCC family protein [Streptomyces sp. GMY02]QXE38248.1 SRPBCC family protein [Streptomyces sp. GMY02]